jgi:hypothetical protein
MSASKPPLRAVRWLAALAALPVLVAVGWSCSFPGCLSVDEMTYLLSARSLADGFGVEVWNGYEEFPSPELAPGWLKVVDGRLVSQYPDFFLFLALPAFRALGFRGLFLVNVLAFAGVLALTWGVARRLFGITTALLALGLLGLSTFSFEYAVAAWPHMTSALFVVAALALVERASSGASSRSSVFAALGAGLLIGFGIGIRLDVAFVGAALGAPLLLLRPVRLREAAALAVGALPALLPLAVLNGRKFGIASPFTYGPSYGIATGIGPHLPVAAAGLAAFVALFVVTRRPPAGDASRRRIVIGAALVLVLGALVTPALRAALDQLTRGFWELVVDLRIRPLHRVEPALLRGPDGGFVYFGSLKKALLQSCPWLVLAGLPIVAALRREESRRAVLFLAAAPAALVGIYSYFAWDGGLALNQRYFVPALPMLAILAAHGLRSLVARSGARFPGLLVAGAVPLALWIGLAEIGRFDYPRQSRLLLNLPLFVAGALLGSLAAVELSTRFGWRRRSWTPLAAWLAATAVVCGGLSAWAYDLPRTLAYRRFHAHLGAEAARFAGADAIVFSQPAELAASALDGHGRIRLANPGKDEYRTFEALARFHAEGERNVLLVVYRPHLERMVATGALAGWRLERVAASEIAEVVRMSPAGAGKTPARAP